MISLKGITWNHSRGIIPLQAASQRYHELHPGVEIRWDKRSLQQFADYPLEKLVEQYDLLIIDHPWVGTAAALHAVLALDEYLPASYLDDQRKQSTGLSHLSYEYNGQQWALAVDAAAPAASYRKDLFEINQALIPETWQDLLQLAGKGKVAVPAIPIDLLMNFYSFCIAAGGNPFSGMEMVSDRETGLNALEMMREFYSLVDQRFFNYNPIQVAELMSSVDDYWYCPFAYCYSNYSREGYAKKLLHYRDLVKMPGGQFFRSTIGGTGLAVSSSGGHIREAVDFAQMLASAEWQSGLYVQNAGQPGYLAAWKSEAANRITNDFFRQVLPVMERGYMRPRYAGYLYFQDKSGEPLYQYLKNGGNAGAVLEKMNTLYRESLTKTELILS